MFNGKKIKSFKDDADKLVSEIKQVDMYQGYDVTDAKLDALRDRAMKLSAVVNKNIWIKKNKNYILNSMIGELVLAYLSLGEIRPMTEIELERLEKSELSFLEKYDVYSKFRQDTKGIFVRSYMWGTQEHGVIAADIFLSDALARRFYAMDDREKNITYMRHISYRFRAMNGMQKENLLRALDKNGVCLYLLNQAVQNYHNSMEKHYRDIMHRIATQPRVKQ